MRTFHQGSAAGGKFWNVEQHGKRLLIHQGKAGTPGRTTSLALAGPEEEAADLERRVRAKLREGFVETSAPPMQRALEEALVANPDDLAAHMAYGDWLGEQHDPALAARGEFVRVQLALEDDRVPTAERKRLEAREQALLDQHAAAWLGPLAPSLLRKEATGTFRFRRGWLDTLGIRTLDLSLARPLECPHARLLRRLTIHDVAVEFDEVIFESYHAAARELVDLTTLANLRVLELGDNSGERLFVIYPDGAAVPMLLTRTPRLVELHVNANNLQASDLFTGYAIKQGLLPDLRVLRLDRVHLEEQGCRDLVPSGLLKQLEVLQLWNAHIDNAGARILAKARDLKRLKLLDVSFNWLDEAGLAVLKKTGVELRAEYQLDRYDYNPDEFEDDFDDEDFDDEFDEDWE